MQPSSSPRARTARPDDRPAPFDNAGPDGAGRLLAALPGDAWWFDLAAVKAPGAPAWLGRPVWLGDLGWLVDPAKWQTSKVSEDATAFDTGFDAMVWFRTMSPQHRWPVATPAAKP